MDDLLLRVLFKMAETADPVVVESVKDVVDAVVETVNDTLNATTKTVGNVTDFVFHFLSLYFSLFPCSIFVHDGIE